MRRWRSHQLITERLPSSLREQQLATDRDERNHERDGQGVRSLRRGVAVDEEPRVQARGQPHRRPEVTHSIEKQAGRAQDHVLPQHVRREDQRGGEPDRDHRDRIPQP